MEKAVLSDPPQVSSKPEHLHIPQQCKGADNHLLFSTEVLSHILVSLLHVLTIQMNVSPAAFLLSVTWKCLQPSVLCIAVHLLPAGTAGSSWW